MESQMYTSVENVKKFLAEHKEKPFIMCEYTHAMGNSCGAMHKYTDLTDTEPKYQGGFIWDYIDQSIYKKDRYGKEFQAYGGDFGERPTDYNFSGNGIAYGGNRDGRTSPEELQSPDFPPLFFLYKCRQYGYFVFYLLLWASELLLLSCASSPFFIYYSRKKSHRQSYIKVASNIFICYIKNKPKHICFYQR